MIEGMYDEKNVLSIFFDNSLDAMYISSNRGKFLKFNTAFKNLLGYSDEELFDMNVSDVYALPQERRRFINEIQKKEAVKKFSVRLKNKNDESIDCLLDAVSWKDNNLISNGYIGTLKPEIKIGISREYEEKENFQFAINGSNDGLWSWNLGTKEISYSSRWKKILGFEDFEIKDTIEEWFKRIHLEDLIRFKNTLNEYLKSKKGALISYFRMLNKKGIYQWMMIRGIYSLDYINKIPILAGSMCNITNHINVLENMKKKETLLSEENEKLKEEKELLSRYFSGEMISEILKTQKNIIKSSVSDACILYIKILNYTDIINNDQPEKITGFLNEIFVDIMDFVYGHKGSVNKLLGDRILVTFGCPINFSGYEESALSCVFDIRQYIKTYNELNPSNNGNILKVGLYLSFGKVISGTFGSIRRLDYSVFGEPVKNVFALSYCNIDTNYDIITDYTSILHLNGKINTKKIDSVKIGQKYQDIFYIESYKK